MSRNRKILISLGVALVVVLGLGFGFRSQLYKAFFRPTQSDISAGVNLQKLNSQPEVLATNLQVPWDVAVLPDGELLVSERPGQLKLVNNNQTIPVSGVVAAGEGGLLGIALHPEFEQNQLLYLYQTTQGDGGLVNRVVRYRLNNAQLSQAKVIIDDIPGANYHDGGQIEFGPDGLLYITSGDAGSPDLAQDTSSLAGKILRLTVDGEIPADNPFNNPVYSYGHRNPQGLAWDDDGQLWSTEHGRSGLQSGFDELNKIESGGNYGWPIIEGNETKTGMIGPVLHSGADETWAPASLAYAQGSLYFGGLRGQTLYEVTDFDTTATITAHFRNDYGRLRAVVADGQSLLITTSNQDGRGSPVETDDRLIKVDLASLNN